VTPNLACSPWMRRYPQVGILPCQSDDEGDGAGGNRWPPGRTSRIGPVPADEVSVPAKQGGRLDEEASETLAGEESCQSGEQCPVGRLMRWAVDLASEHRHLMAQDDDLDREVRVPCDRRAGSAGGRDRTPPTGKRGPPPDARRIRRLTSKSSSRPMDGVLGTHRSVSISGERFCL